MLTSCRNFRPSAEGLASYEPLTKLTDNDTLIDWPFPQVFRGKSGTFIFERAYIQLYNEITGDTTPVPVYPPGSATQTNITAGGTWQFADFGGSWVASNGVNVVYKKANDTKARVVTRTVRALCAFQQRLFFAMDEVFNSAWQTMVSGWIDNAPAGFGDTLTTPDNLVFWTNVGTLAMFWWLLDPTDAITGDLDTHEEGRALVTEFIAAGDFGFGVATFRNRCIRLESLGNSVIAYADDGVSRFTPIVSPAVTCSITAIPSTGIMSRSSIAATPSRHIFLSSSGALWELSDGNAQRIDFTEFSAQMGSQVIGCANMEEGLLYLSDGTQSLLFTPTGVSQVSECPTSIIAVRGEQRAYITYGPEAIQNGELILNCFDFGVRGAKTICEVRIAGTLPDDATVSVEYRDDPLEDWQRDTDTYVNREGVSDINCTAVEHRIVVNCTDWQGASIDYIEVTWKPFDLRYNTRIPRYTEA